MFSFVCWISSQSPFCICLKLMLVCFGQHPECHWCWSSLVIFMLQTVQGAPWHLILLWIYNLDNQKSHITWEAAAPRQGHPCVIRSIKFQFTSSLLLWTWFMLRKGVLICMKMCHHNMFICHPLHYIHITSYRQLPSVNCCNILIQIVLFVIYIWDPL